MATVEIQLVGDVLLTRTNPPESPFHRVDRTLKAADIVSFNNEAPYAVVGSPQLYGALGHDPECMAALADAGFHACTFANNHCMAWGAEAMLECMKRLDGMGIAVCGTGANDQQAAAPIVLERKGLRVAFLGYNCIGPKGYMAEPDKPGCAMVRIHTHYEPYEYTPGSPALVVTRAYLGDLHAMVENIRRARAAADFVIVYFHWGLHLSRAMICDYQFEVGHSAIDAGASAVLGCGPHNLKGIEVYKGAPIFYSLGNFCFTHPGPQDRKEDFAQGRITKSIMEMTGKVYTRSPEDRAYSLVASLRIADQGKLVQTSFRPVILDAAGTPEVVKPGSSGGTAVNRHVATITAEVGIDTDYQQEDDEVLVLPGKTAWKPKVFAPLTPQ